MILSSVDLPVPLGPTTPILAPCRNDSVTLSRTTLSPWALRTLRRVKTYSAMTGNPTGSAARAAIGRSAPATAQAARAGCSAAPVSSIAGAAIGNALRALAGCSPRRWRR